MGVSSAHHGCRVSLRLGLSLSRAFPLKPKTCHYDGSFFVARSGRGRGEVGDFIDYWAIESVVRIVTFSYSTEFDDELGVAVLWSNLQRINHFD